ncbi:LEA type 2 family protein [Hydrogenophaga sp.]|uniref:LEA type 2 family protein n=1 Tax=Hydrogenophaga sp. TaxID=1904254 RepID=UPI003F6D396F
MNSLPSAIHTRRSWLVLALAGGLSAWASLAPGDPPRVDVVGVEPMPGQGMEVRLLVKLRVINPNDSALEYDGLFVEMDVRGKSFASGVSNARGTVPRFGETVLSVPVTVPALAMLRQALGMAQGDRSPIGYVISGKLSGPQWRSLRFNSAGEFKLPD